ncbi:MAG: glutamate--cysteine ligase EgtA [Acidimicrobiia bacterium]
MPAAQPVLHLEDATRIVAARGFEADGGRGPRRMGIEMEWCTVRLDEPSLPADFDAVQRGAAAATLPHASRVSFEPGGQVELSSEALPGLLAIPSLRADAAALGAALHREGVGMVAIGLEPGTRRARFLRSPRYDAMEAFFDAASDAGRTMMRSTAALQVNLDLGPTSEVEARWSLVHAVGPVLAATFAHSPFAGGRPSGWRSTRLAVWKHVDPGRTAPVANGVRGPEAWAAYALAADVMLVRHRRDEHLPVPPGLSFAEWIARGHPAGWPDVDDLDYHLTTLFPPVRPRGWYELRMIDALGARWWPVAAAVATVLLDDPDAAACARRATAPVRDRWDDAARHGLAHPDLAAAAQHCFRAARSALGRRGADPATIDATGEFEDRFVRRGRTPADDLLDAWHRSGTLLPPADNA